MLFGRDHDKHFLRMSRGSSPSNYLNALAGGFSGVTFMIGVARGPVTGDRVIRFATAAVVFAVAAFA